MTKTIVKTREEAHKLWKEGVVNVLVQLNKVDGLIWYVFNPNNEMFDYLKKKYKMYGTYSTGPNMESFKDVTSVEDYTHLAVYNYGMTVHLFK